MSYKKSIFHISIFKRSSVMKKMQKFYFRISCLVEPNILTFSKRPTFQHPVIIQYQYSLCRREHKQVLNKHKRKLTWLQTPVRHWYSLAVGFRLESLQLIWHWGKSHICCSFGLSRSEQNMSASISPVCDWHLTCLCWQPPSPHDLLH